MGKLDMRSGLYYIVFENAGPVSYMINDQLNRSVVKAHFEHHMAANIEVWRISTDNRPL